MPKDEGKHAQPPTLRAFPYQLETLHWRPDHLENEEGVYCYCGKGKAAKGKTTETEPMLSCSSCRQLFHSDCVACLPRKLLEGDAFYTFTCSVCGNGTQRYERSTMSWMVVTQLVLYTLYQRHPDKEFFRWREDICLFIDEYWQYLKPGAPRSPTWHNTVASVLSTAQNKVFRSGTATLGPGWWALKVIEPPQPGVTKGGPKSKKSAVQPTKKQIVPQLRRRASSASSFGDAPSASKSATPARTKVKQKPVPKRKLVEDSPRAPTPKKAKSESKTEPKTEGMQGKSAKAPRKHLGKAPTLVKETTPSLLADIFGDSDSDLSSHDSYLSSTEGSPAKGAGKQPRKGGKHPWASKATKGPGLRKFAQKGQKRSVSESSSSIFSSSKDEIPQTSRTLPGSVAVPQIEADSSSSSSDASGIFSDNASDGFEEEREESDEESSENDLPTIPVNDEEPQRVIAVVPRKPAKVEAKTSAPAHHMLMTLEQEHALLQRLSATTHLPAPLARLRRKIHLRRLKRSVGVPLFDLDAVVSRTLRDHPSRTLTPLVHRSDGLPSLVTLPDGRVSRLVVRGMDPRSALVRFRAVVPVTTTPYANSFLSRLQGNVQP
ncbi:Cysteine-rich protein 2-binding protein, partial [Thoreauomyces humboldtii]